MTKSYARGFNIQRFKGIYRIINHRVPQEGMLLLVLIQMEVKYRAVAKHTLRYCLRLLLL